MSVAFQRVTQLAAPPETVFDRSLDVDAHLQSMARSRERAVGGVTHGRLAAGDTVTWQARHFGWTFRMTSRIADYERPHRFVDEQVDGPFAWFRHVHGFEAHDGGTRMFDDVAFAAPLGVLGRIAEFLVLRRYLQRLIDVRNDYLVAEFGST